GVSNRGRTSPISLTDRRRILSASLQQLRVERDALSRLAHPNVVALVGSSLTAGQPCFVALELSTGGEIFDEVLQRRQKLSMDDDELGGLPSERARRYCHALLSALAHCHSRGVYHRDLKLENLLLSHDGDDAEVRLVDFGLAAWGASLLCKTTNGSLQYAAPELLASSAYELSKVDVWSGGIVLYAMVTGMLPFVYSYIYMYNNGVTCLCCYVKQGGRRQLGWLPAPTADLLRRMLDPNPANRPSAQLLLQHPWLRGDSGKFPRSLIVGAAARVPVEEGRVAVAGFTSARIDLLALAKSKATAKARIPLRL
ncbi:kinase-like domain-containing protein, partial [Pavlovales sp. CCMP2436]